MVDDQIPHLREDMFRDLVFVGLRRLFQLAFLVAHRNRLAVFPEAAVLHPLILENQRVLRRFQRKAVGILFKPEVQGQRGGFLSAMVQQTVRLARNIDLQVT